MEKDPLYPLPHGLEAYENQVAGHGVKDGKAPTGILKDSDGSILKPLVKHPQSECEVQFYQRINSNELPLSLLQQFTPQYKGTVNYSIGERNVPYLKLADITHGFIKPCVMDIKIGARTWAPDASEEKRQNEDKKYALTKKTLGFCIPGYKVYNISSNLVTSFGKIEGKALTPNNVPNVLKDFFNYESGHMSFLIDNYMPTLKKMLEWWDSQEVVHIYSSSLLFTYDAHILNTKKDSTDVSPWVKVWMIDFAHVTPATSVDSNYRDGLFKLISMLQELRLNEE